VGRGRTADPPVSLLRRATPFVLSLLVAFLAAEITLRVAGFRYELKATVIEAQAPNRDKVFEGYALDPDLLWTRRDYPKTLNLALDSRPDILFMGDSCTEFGDYDRRLLARLRRLGGPDFRHANFGCAGWSTWQGLQQMIRDVRRVRPRVVTIYYGWNDHWLSVGVDDRGVARLNESALYRLRGLRLAQLATKAWVAVAARRSGGPPPRVSESEFGANLQAMVRTAREIGAVPVLVTAPSPGRENEGRWTGGLSRFPAIHRRYAEIVREVARNENAALCDAMAEFDAIPRDRLRAEFFYRDEVHLTEAGNEMLAEVLFASLARQGLLERAGEAPRPPDVRQSDLH
jgi:lysophospholipase L1-like esterase